MLLSMTGQGEARVSHQSSDISVEVRTVNSRFLKVSVRTNEGFSSLESRIEERVRQSVRRGTVQVNARCDLLGRVEYRLNLDRVHSYLQQLRGLADDKNPQMDVSWNAVLALPGVVDEPHLDRDTDKHWLLVAPVLDEALSRLNAMRRREGEAMRVDLISNLDQIDTQLQRVKERAPEIVASYQKRLVDRLNALLEKSGVVVEAGDLVREVGVFAERCDVSEEIVRLFSHLDQYRSILDEKTSSGRKLDFLNQELHREVNTIGSKANDAELASLVVEMKTLIERMREMIQNVE
jgi:uncharacterized protein (TIGR00255 family)